MRLRLIWLLSAALAVSAQAPLSLQQYRELLAHADELARRKNADLALLRASIPATVHVQTPQGTLDIDNTPLLRVISADNTKDVDNRSEALESLHDDLQSRISDIAAYERPTDPTERPKLADILDRKEFHRVKRADPATAIRRLLFLALLKLFSLITNNPDRAGLYARIFLWTVVSIVGLFLLWLTYRWLGREGPPSAPRQIVPFAPSSRDWQDWLHAARSAAASGDLREAVHLAYWAGISLLESNGSWRPDKARTPREYLRLLGNAPGHPELTRVTRIFEKTWYGERQPTEQEFSSVIDDLGRLGCR